MKTKIIAISLFIVIATMMITFLNPGKKIEIVNSLPSLEIEDKDPIIEVNKEELILVKSQSYNLLDNASIKDDYDDIKIEVNISNTSILNCGFYDIKYTASDRKNNKVEKIIKLEIIAEYDDYDSDGYSNIEEYENNTDFLNHNDYPLYDKNPTINIKKFKETINIYEELEYDVNAYDFYDGYLNVEVYTNLNKNVTGTYYVIFRTFDKLGNQTQITKNVNVVDNRTLEFTSLNSDYNGEWTNQDVTINYSFNKKVKKVLYSFDLDTWNENKENSLTISSSVNGKVYIKGIEDNGNESNIVNMNLKIDKEVISIKNNSLTIEANKNEVYSCNTEITSFSGVKEVKTSNDVDMGKTGIYSCSYEILNNAGTKIIKEQSINVIDTTKPTLKNLEINMLENEDLKEKLDIIENTNDEVIIEILNESPLGIGTYNINVKLTDSSNNSSETTIIVNVYKYIIEDLTVDNTLTYSNDLELKNVVINNIELINTKLEKINENTYKRVYDIKDIESEKTIEVDSEIISIIENNIEIETEEFTFTPSVGFRLK